MFLLNWPMTPYIRLKLLHFLNSSVVGLSLSMYPIRPGFELILVFAEPLFLLVLRRAEKSYISFFSVSDHMGRFSLT